MRKRPLCSLALIVICISCLADCRILLRADSGTKMPYSEKEVVSAEGEIYKREIKNHSCVLYLKDAQVRNKDISVENQTLLVYLKKEGQYQIGNRVSCVGKIQYFQIPRNKGQFNEKQFYQILGIDCKIRDADCKITNRSCLVLKEWLASAKDSFSRQLSKIFREEDASVLQAMTVGDKHNLSEETRARYQSAGIIHIISISGLHVSMIGMGLFVLFRKTGRGYFFSGAVSSAILLLFGLLTGFGVSTVRAVLMFLAAMGAQILGRTYDLLSALALAAILILISQPLYLLHSGFLLSFGAVLGICVAGGVLTEVFSGAAVWQKTLLTSLAVQFTTLPVLLYFYYQYALYSVLVNLIVLPFMAFVLFSGIAGGISSYLSYSAGVFLGGAGHFILVFYSILCQWIQRIPYSNLILGQPSLLQIFIYLFLLFGTLALMKEKKRKRYLFLLLILPCMFVIKFPYDLRITFLDVGQGDGILMETPSGNHYLIDGGSSDVSKVGTYRILPALKAYGVSSLQYAFISHADSDHISGVMELIEQSGRNGVRLECLVLSDLAGEDENVSALIKLAEEHQVRVAYMGRGDLLRDGALTLRCLYPPKKIHTEDRNASSMVLQLDYQRFRMLFTGDMEETAESALLKSGSLTRCHVLKAAHHGSKFSNCQAVLETVSPRICVISCGIENRYGHPHEDFLQRLNEVSCVSYQTPECGAVEISVKRSEYTVKWFLDSRLLFKGESYKIE